MGSKRRRNQKKKVVPDPTEQDMSRFDDGEDDEDADESDAKRVKAPSQAEDAEDDGDSQPAVPLNYDADDNIESEGEESGIEEMDQGSEKEEDDGYGKFIDPDTAASSASKMADAMAKILGTNVTKSAPVVLAKTRTPLQKMAQEEKAKLKEMRIKKQAKRERNLTALHIPMSVATTNQIKSVSKELEHERIHRRVATRGVVALFNAISQHQKATEEEEVEAKKSEAPKLTKHGFLDKIKSSAAANTAATSRMKLFGGSLADATEDDEE